MITADERMNEDRPEIYPRTCQVAVVVHVHVELPAWRNEVEIDIVGLVAAGNGSFDRKPMALGQGGNIGFCHTVLAQTATRVLRGLRFASLARRAGFSVSARHARRWRKLCAGKSIMGEIFPCTRRVPPIGVSAAFVAFAGT
jgi:hypothetical protein